MDDITAAVAALGPGPLQDASLRRCVDPLFSRVLGANPGTIYLANHSLGRPLDKMQADLMRFAAVWYDDFGGAWAEWLAAVAAFRTNVGALINAPEPGCIVPKNSAGQGLRAVLNCFDRPIRVLATRSEFDSIDFLLKSFAGARARRAAMDRAACRRAVSERRLHRWIGVQARSHRFFSRFL